MLAMGLSLCPLAYPVGWTTNQRLTWTSGDSYGPAIAVDLSGHLHLVWDDYESLSREIYYKKSTDAGASWTTARRLTWTSGGSRVPSIAIDSLGHLHLVWNDDTPGKLETYYKKSPDGGVGWSASQRLTWTSSGSREPRIAVDSSGNPHVVWWEEAYANSDIYYARMGAPGHKSKTHLTPSWSYSRSSPEISSVTFTSRDDYAGSSNYEIYHKKTTDGGANWTSAQRLTWTSGDSYDPVMAFDSSGNSSVVWIDQTPGDYQVYWKMSTDGGSTWQASQRISWTSVRSWSLAMAADSSGNLHLVWRDYSPGNWEIYYKKYVK
jgi:hypothetical protein